MYVFFLTCFIIVSICLIFLILLQPGKGINNFSNSDTINNIKVFNNIRANNFITKIIAFFTFLFLMISIILCNVNSIHDIENNFFLEDSTTKIIKNKPLIEKKSFHSELPD
ncbi:preprotein translocase subunit SecG [Buchnera aphidicola (Hyadaphis tataricae)]|uniref:Protein-export membrane protein SecG n=1 Tax=Buchnera aphidicola (Hyadaphis tataricae) TaxID=1241859 RepID=A0A4D6XUY9_9GAMM|nr:preprotein translocase subunit SecG [Buchnera aphidicola]QCI21672.1 preprotein translocase subunit SecG [Buchnera aphidicola (Hyadaphis tataricae)]